MARWKALDILSLVPDFRLCARAVQALGAVGTLKPPKPELLSSPEDAHPDGSVS